jgi:hypothetical protein
MDKHTPGPWAVGFQGGISGPRASASIWLDGHHGWAPVSKKNETDFAGCARLIAIVPNGEGSTEADASLIAAAPDLLAALQSAEECIATDYGHGVRNGYWPEVKPILDQIRAAIKKARGE